MSGLVARFIRLNLNAPDYADQSNGHPYGLAWDGNHLWASNSNGIYMLDPTTGAVLAACNDSAVKYGQAYGLTWDGHFLWGSSWITNSIIKIDVSALLGNPLIKGDLNGDGKTDILWRNVSTGENIVWFMNGAALSGWDYLLPVSDMNWTIVNH